MSNELNSSLSLLQKLQVLYMFPPTYVLFFDCLMFIVTNLRDAFAKYIQKNKKIKE